MHMKERKMLLRRQIEERRSRLSPAERSMKEESINRAIVAEIQEIHKREPVTLLTYMPFRGEADITPVMEMCWTEGICVLVPKTIQKTKGMTLHEVQSYDQLSVGAYGIREPKENSQAFSNLRAISVILVPGIGFDRQFGRLGYGGGYYDRFVQAFAARKLPRPQLIAPAFDVQIVPQVPISWHDFLVDRIVTETLNLRRGK